LKSTPQRRPETASRIGAQRLEVRLFLPIDGRGHCDDEEVGLAQSSRVRRHAQPRLAQDLAVDLPGPILSGGQARELVCVDVKADGAWEVPGHRHGQG
jgi:hypothetical protein